MPQAEIGEGVIERDIRCIQCKYNLRGLETGRKCPECGTEIEESITAQKQREHRRLRQQRMFFVTRGRLLSLLTRERGKGLEVPIAQADPAWRREMAEAAILLCVALAWPLVGLPIGGWLVDWSMILRSGHHGTFGRPWFVRAGYLACYCVPWALSALAMWKASIREMVPPHFRRDRARTRIAIRGLGIAWFLAPVAINPFEYGPNPEGAWFVLATVPLTILIFYRFRAVARRAGEGELGGQFLALAWVSAFFSFVAPVFGSAGISHRSQLWADEVFALLPLPGAGMTWYLAWFRDVYLPLLGAIMIGLALWECITLIGLAKILRKGLKPNGSRNRSGSVHSGRWGE